MTIEPTEFEPEEIARMEGISVEEVNAIIEGAFTKLRRLLPQMKKEDE
jgi:DNA-directed RNA polymerase specialized sigma24 family protein